MMGDHQFQEAGVEGRAVQLGQRRHLRRTGHPRHHLPVHAVAGHIMAHGGVGGGVGNRLPPAAQPALHERDLVFLRGIDPLGRIAQRLIAGALRHQRGHLQRLMMVMDHALHEGGVIRAEAGVRNAGRLVCAQLLARLARRARLHDRRLLGQCRRGECGRGQAGGGEDRGQQGAGGGADGR